MLPPRPRTWPRCASGTALSGTRRTWTGWWAWAAPGTGRRESRTETPHFRAIRFFFFKFIYLVLPFFCFFRWFFCCCCFDFHFVTRRGDVSPQRQRRPGDALQGGQGGGQDGALRLHGTTRVAFSSQGFKKKKKRQEKGKKPDPALGIFYLKAKPVVVAQRPARAPRVPSARR